MKLAYLWIAIILSVVVIIWAERCAIEYRDEHREDERQLQAAMELLQTHPTAAGKPKEKQ